MMDTGETRERREPKGHEKTLRQKNRIRTPPGKRKITDEVRPEHQSISYRPNLSGKRTGHTKTVIRLLL